MHQHKPQQTEAQIPMTCQPGEESVLTVIHTPATRALSDVIRPPLIPRLEKAGVNFSKRMGKGTGSSIPLCYFFMNI